MNTTSASGWSKAPPEAPSSPFEGRSGRSGSGFFQGPSPPPGAPNTAFSAPSNLFGLHAAAGSGNPPRSGSSTPPLLQPSEGSGGFASHGFNVGPFGSGPLPPPGLHPMDHASFDRLGTHAGAGGGGNSNSSSGSPLAGGPMDEEAAAAARRWASMLNSSTATAPPGAASGAFGPPGPSARKSASYNSLNETAAAAAAAAVSTLGSLNYIPTAALNASGGLPGTPRREVHTSPGDLFDYSPLSQESNLGGGFSSVNSNLMGGAGGGYHAATLPNGALASTLSPLAAMAVYGEESVGVQSLFGANDGAPLGISNRLQLLLQQQQQQQQQQGSGGAGTNMGSAAMPPGTPGGPGGGQQGGGRGMMPPGSPQGAMLSTDRLLALAAAGGQLSGMGPAGLDFGLGGFTNGLGKPLSSSLYIKNLPGDADKLFLYERFCPYGAILSVKVLTDPDSGTCRGVGFVNYADHPSAIRAIQALHGTKVGEKLLHVSLQTPRVRVPGL